jgi:hypothetical protein
MRARKSNSQRAPAVVVLAGDRPADCRSRPIAPEQITQSANGTSPAIGTSRVELAATVGAARAARRARSAGPAETELHGLLSHGSC